ncbi:MAG TPA: patatin-like phospholipase family protein [Syntrophomonas sp.]|nr:patatin-like phospholipase family protein [Syntrophomonas sp.]
MEKSRPTIALVLGAGSARGLAHIGVLQVLKEAGIDCDFIVGSSMGAMVGAIYASGADLYMLEKMLDCMDTNLMIDVQVPRFGFVAGKRVDSFLALMTKNKTFEQLDPPVIAVATDLISGERVVFDQGPVREAVRASISIPGIFTPVYKDDMVLVDGAVIDRLPVEVARERGADIIIAVDVTFDPNRKIVIKNTIDVIMTALDIMQKHHFNVSSPQADVLIQPAVGNFGSRDFEKSDELITLGREATLARMEEIRQAIKDFKSGSET